MSDVELCPICNHSLQLHGVVQGKFRHLSFSDGMYMCIFSSDQDNYPVGSSIYTVNREQDCDCLYTKDEYE